jgi:hypothetical protein
MIQNINLVDASGIFHRINYFSTRTELTGQQLKLAFEFINQSRYLLQADSTNKAIWLLDCESRNYWRSDYYPDYKGTRSQQSTASGITEEFERCASTSGYAWLRFPTFEADDIVGALVRMLTPRMPSGYHINLVTADSDWQGLISNRVTGVYHQNPTIRDRRIVYDWLSRKWAKQSKTKQKAWILPSFNNFDCSQIWDWKRAVGDRTDNLKAGSLLGLFSLINPTIDLLARSDFKEKATSAICRAKVYSCDLRTTQEYLANLLEPPIPIVRLN